VKDQDESRRPEQGLRHQSAGTASSPTGPATCQTFPLRIAIVCAIRLYREGLANALERLVDFEVVFAGADERAAIDYITERIPDVALVDMAMLDSIHAVRAITNQASGVKVIALAVPETEGHVLACAEAGIVGYVPRDASLENLIITVRSVARGETLCSPTIAAGLMRRVAVLARRPGYATHRSLTSREVDIIELVGRGLSNKQIAHQLNIGLPTVKNHVHNILSKLALQSRVEAGVAWQELRAGWGVDRPVRNMPQSSVRVSGSSR
jgi:two-component system nitrate/nitrite response regulator NarL